MGIENQNFQYWNSKMIKYVFSDAPSRQNGNPLYINEE